MVEWIPGDKKNIFRSKPHLKYENYFSGDLICNCMGQNGFSLTTTFRRDRLPKYVPGKYLHNNRTDTIKKSMVENLFELVVTVKEVDTYGRKDGYRIVYVSLQPTSSYNFLLSIKSIIVLHQ